MWVWQVSGLTMWTYGIQNPMTMQAELGIQSDMKRAHVSESVCREIVQQGCLQDGMWEGLFGGWEFWSKWGALVLHYLSLAASSLVRPSPEAPQPLVVHRSRGGGVHGMARAESLEHRQCSIDTRLVAGRWRSLVHDWRLLGLGRRGSCPHMSLSAAHVSLQQWCAAVAAMC